MYPKFNLHVLKWSEVLFVIGRYYLKTKKSSVTSQVTIPNSYQQFSLCPVSCSRTVYYIITFPSVSLEFLSCCFLHQRLFSRTSTFILLILFSPFTSNFVSVFSDVSRINRISTVYCFLVLKHLLHNFHPSVVYKHLDSLCYHPPPSSIKHIFLS